MRRADGTAGQPVDATTQQVSKAGLADVRHRVAAACGAAGLTDGDAGRFTTAVNEVVTNAIEHGGGIANVTITTYRDRVVVDVSDTGGGLPTGLPIELPPAHEVHGRGLWLAQQFSDEISFRSTDSGTNVRLTASVADRHQ